LGEAVDSVAEEVVDEEEDVGDDDDDDEEDVEKIAEVQALEVDGKRTRNSLWRNPSLCGGTRSSRCRQATRKETKKDRCCFNCKSMYDDL
jgi:hypothetical protein